MRRVVVTGLGLLTPLGHWVDVTWKNIVAGKSGANRITAFDTTDYACQIACEVPRVDGRGGGGPDVEGSFDPNNTMAPKDQRKVDDFILYGHGRGRRGCGAIRAGSRRPRKTATAPASSWAPASAASTPLPRRPSSCATRVRAGFPPSSFPRP